MGDARHTPDTGQSKRPETHAELGEQNSKPQRSNTKQSTRSTPDTGQSKRPDLGEQKSSVPQQQGDPRRRKLVWESLLGFAGFFTLMAFIQAVWNLFQDSPAVFPSVLLAFCVLVTWLVWRKYRHL